VRADAGPALARAAAPSPASLHGALLAQLSDGQRQALDAVTRWYDDGGPRPLILGGLAGTGKTTLAGLLPGLLGDARIAFCAYTGKAVQVLRGKLDALRASPAVVSTIHRLLYRPAVLAYCADSTGMLPAGEDRCAAHQRREQPCPAAQQVSFTPVPEPLAGLDLVVADEASMIPERLWADLTSHGVPVLAIGDHGQLPPVQSAFSLMAAPHLRLEEIHRQSAADPAGMAILNVARWAREQGHIPHGVYGPGVAKIRPDRIGYDGLHPGEADMILCATNRTRAYHNEAMRAWHGRSGPPQPGDVVICLRNNHAEGLFNGQRGVILQAGEPRLRGGEETCPMTIGLDALDEPWQGEVARRLFGAPPGAARGIRDRDLALFDYGYAQTVHKSQGSEADKVLVIEEPWPPPGTGTRARWLYTAVTRAKRELTVAGW
jgi:exodeoxyribonuclease-5